MADNDEAGGVNLVEDRRKIVVLDTNVPVNYPRAPESSFDDNCVFIPEVLIEELDSLKRNSGTERSAREALRVLERLSEKGDLRKGVALDNGGTLFVFPRIDDENFFGMDRTPDNEVVATALLLQQANMDRPVVVISDDTGVLLKARYCNLAAERYSPRTPLNTSVLFEKEDEIILSEDFYQSLNEHNFVVLGENRLPNHVYGVRSHSAPDSFEECFIQSDGRTLQRICPEKLASAGVGSGNFRQKAAYEALLDPDISFVCLLGRAGTLKTILSLAAGIQQVRENIYERIVVLRPPVPVGGKDKTGFLPGGLVEKLYPWMGPIFDNLSYLFKANGKKAGSPFKMIMSRYGGNHEKMIEAALKEFCISMESFDHLQGRTFADAFVIVDEAQNLPLDQAKMVGTRAGENSKFVFNGDISQRAVGPFSGRASNGLALTAAAFVDKSTASIIELKKVERSKLAELFGNIGEP